MTRVKSLILHEHISGVYSIAEKAMRCLITSVTHRALRADVKDVTVVCGEYSGAESEGNSGRVTVA